MNANHVTTRTLKQDLYVHLSYFEYIVSLLIIASYLQAKNSDNKLWLLFMIHIFLIYFNEVQRICKRVLIFIWRYVNSKQSIIYIYINFTILSIFGCEWLLEILSSYYSLYKITKKTIFFPYLATNLCC